MIVDIILIQERSLLVQLLLLDQRGEVFVPLWLLVPRREVYTLVKIVWGHLDIDTDRFISVQTLVQLTHIRWLVQHLSCNFILGLWNFQRHRLAHCIFQVLEIFVLYFDRLVKVWVLWWNVIYIFRTFLIFLENEVVNLVLRWQLGIYIFESIA